MNTRSFINKLKTFFLRVNNRIDLKILLFLLLTSLISTNEVLGQKKVWRYVTTVYGGDKGYLNDEIKILFNGNKSAWEKMVSTDGSFAVALGEWNCSDKLRLTKQISFYRSDQTIIGTSKKQSEWTEIIPDSISDLMFRRVCLASPPVKFARIISLKANLRIFPDVSAPIIRIADQGDKFQIIPESGKGGWYNVVDSVTQQDYWLYGNTFEIVESTPVKQEQKKKKSSPNDLNHKRQSNPTRKRKG